jgi:small subunit ribosomal protein S1
MTEKLIEGVNIGKLPDPFPFIKSNKIPKVKSEGDISKEYLDMYRQMEKTFLSMREIKKDEVVTGVIASKTDKEILVDFGYKDYIYVDTPKKTTFSADFKEGDPIDVLITEVSDDPFYVKGSITELIKFNVHSKMKQYFEQSLPLTASVKNLIPAGYMMDIHMDNVTVEAFMPNTLADVNKLSNVDSILGQTFEVMLETLQQEKGVYVVSRRKYLQTLIPAEIKKLRTNTVYKGEVTGTTPFGVFVQFNGCLTGMVHKANIDEYWHDKWDQIFPGMSIEFYVKEIIKNSKIILTQILKESLWDNIKVGKILTGTVRDIKSFGALIELDPETTGLIQTTYITKNNKSLNAGDSVKVKVISLIKDERKIYLNFAEGK